MTTVTRAYVSRLAGLPVFDPNGDRVGRVRDVVVALRVGTATPRVLGLVVEVVARRRIFVPMGRVTSVDPGAVVLASGTLNLKRFEQRRGETLVLGELLDRAVTIAESGRRATVVDAGRPVSLRGVCEDLHRRGIRRLMVEGGGTVHTQFLADDLVDELQLVVAPFFVGDSSAPRFVSDGRFPWNAGRRATLAEVRQIGDVVLLRYALSPRFRDG